MKVVSVHIGRQKYQTTIKSDDHEYFADEPEDQGGGNAGPDPYEFLLSALGSCTAITLRMYADRKKWPLEELEIILRHQKKHSDDCAHCDESESAWLDHIDITINFIGALSEEQIGRLLVIADKCPVHKTMTNNVHIQTHAARRKNCN